MDLAKFKNAIFALCAIFAFLFALNAFTPIYGDDFAFLGDYYTKGALGFMKEYYFEWNARLLNLLYGGFIVWWNPLAFDALNAAFGAIFVAALYCVLCWDFRREFSLQDAFLCALLIFLLCVATSFMSVFIWGTGSVNYLWDSAIFMLCALEIKARILGRFAAFLDSKICAALFVIFSALAAFSHEILALFGAMFYVFLFILWKCGLLEKRESAHESGLESLESHKFPRRYIFAFLICVIAVIFILTAPGTQNRALIEAERYALLGVGEILALPLNEMLARIAQTLAMVGAKTPIILLLVLFIASFWRFLARVNFKNCAFFALAFLAFFALCAIDSMLAMIVLFFLQFGIWRREDSRKNLLILCAFFAWFLLCFGYIQIGQNLMLRARFIDLALLISIVILRAGDFNFNRRFVAISLVAFGAFCLYTLLQFGIMRAKWDEFYDFMLAQKAQHGAEAEIIYPAEKFNNAYFMIDSNFKTRENPLDYASWSEIFGVKSVEFR